MIGIFHTTNKLGGLKTTEHLKNGIASQLRCYFNYTRGTLDIPIFQGKKYFKSQEAMWTSQSKSNPLNAGGSPLMLPAGPASNDKTAPEVGEDASGYLHLSVVQDSIQRWNVLSSLLEPLPKPSPRVLSFASQSKFFPPCYSLPKPIIQHQRPLTSK